MSGESVWRQCNGIEFYIKYEELPGKTFMFKANPVFDDQWEDFEIVLAVQDVNRVDPEPGVGDVYQIFRLTLEELFNRSFRLKSLEE